MSSLWHWFRHLPAGWQTAIRLAAAAAFSVAFILGYSLLVGAGHPYLVGLFPVIICTLVLRFGAGVLSLAITAAYINWFEISPESLFARVVATTFYLAEGFLLMWIAEARTRARANLAANLQQRKLELAQLRRAHKELAAVQQRQDQSIGQLRHSNQVMLDTLERIMGRSNR